MIALALSLCAQEPERPRAVVTRVEHGPTVDGRLDEEFWRTAPTIGPLRQMVPGIDAEPSEATEIRLVHDGRSLYFGIRCFDRDPAGIVATLRQRDADLDPDDRIEILLDTFRDRRNAYFFQIGAAGSIGDALVARNGGAFKKAWDGIFDGAARIDELGWSAEIEIPFATVAFDPNDPTWGFNINRCIKRREEFARWAGLTQDASFFQIARAGDLLGFEGARQGIGIDLVPFFVARLDDEHGEDASLTGQPGFDATWRITPSLQAALTVNTDFAETEVDDRQINLTRFPLFFPEKRDFFLQDAGIFDFADVGSDTLLPFFSRRIGLSGGEEVPILAGGKLTGRAGEWNIGLLDVQTDDTSDLDGQNLGVARISRNIGEQSTVGIIATAGDPSGETNTSTYGADLNLATDAFLDDKNLSSSVWVLRTEDGIDNEGGDLAYGASLRYPNDFFSFELAYAEIQEAFDPALGFVPRTDIRRYTGSMGIEPRWEGVVRRTTHDVHVDVTTDLDDELETGIVGVQPVGVEFDSGDEVALSVEGTRDRLDAPFEIEEGIAIPTGTYDFASVRLEIETSNKRELSGMIGLSGGTFYDGARNDVELSTSWRPSALLNASIAYERNDVDLDEGAFVVHVGRARVDLTFSPKLQWSNFVQFDNQSDTAGLNSRLRWIFGPGQELYVVVNPTVARTLGSLVVEETAAAFKIAYTMRF